MTKDQKALQDLLEKLPTLKELLDSTPFHHITVTSQDGRPAYAEIVLRYKLQTN